MHHDPEAATEAAGLTEPSINRVSIGVAARVSTGTTALPTLGLCCCIEVSGELDSAGVTPDDGLKTGAWALSMAAGPGLTGRGGWGWLAEITEGEWA